MKKTVMTILGLVLWGTFDLSAKAGELKLPIQLPDPRCIVQNAKNIPDWCGSDEQTRDFEESDLRFERVNALCSGAHDEIPIEIKWVSHRPHYEAIIVGGYRIYVINQTYGEGDFVIYNLKGIPSQEDYRKVEFKGTLDLSGPSGEGAEFPATLEFGDSIIDLECQQ